MLIILFLQLFYVADFQSARRLDGRQASSSLSSVLDQFNSVVPHSVGHPVDVLAETQSVLEIRFEMARLFQLNLSQVT